MSVRERIIAEVAKVPEEKLGEIYSLVHQLTNPSNDAKENNRTIAVQAWLKTACGAARPGVTTAELQAMTRDAE